MEGYPGDADVEVCAACPSAQVLHLLLLSTHVGLLEDERGERRHPAQVQHPIEQVRHAVGQITELQRGERGHTAPQRPPSSLRKWLEARGCAGSACSAAPSGYYKCPPSHSTPCSPSSRWGTSPSCPPSPPSSALDIAQDTTCRGCRSTWSMWLAWRRSRQHPTRAAQAPSARSLAGAPSPTCSPPRRALPP